jgi:2-isopropylmalate synthase
VEFFQAAKSIGFKHAKLAAFGSTRRANTPVEEDPQVKLLLEAETPVVTIFGKSWEMHVTEILRTTVEENQSMIRETVAHLVKHGREVIYDAEHFFDGYKDSPEHALATLKAAADGGAACLVLCDTNGGTLPSEIATICAAVHAHLPTSSIGIHTHNDCELAVANAIAAVNAGAIHVQGTINGYGERTGNCNLTSVIPILQLKMGLAVVPRLEGLRDLSWFVDDVSNNPHFARAAFIGRTAFAHKGGMHVNAVQKLARSYEHITPESVGNEQTILVSELSGQSNILLKAEQMGMPIEKGAPEAARILARIKELEHEGYSFEAAGGSLELLIRRELGKYFKPFEANEYHRTHRRGRSWRGERPRPRPAESAATFLSGDRGSLSRRLQGPHPRRPRRHRRQNPRSHRLRPRRRNMGHHRRLGKHHRGQLVGARRWHRPLPSAERLRALPIDTTSARR